MKEKCMEILKKSFDDGTAPFFRDISKDDFFEDIDVSIPHIEVEKTIFDKLDGVRNKNLTNTMAILAAPGGGKTHLFKILKNKEDLLNCKVVRISTIKDPSRPFYSIYNSLIEGLGEKLLLKIVRSHIENKLKSRSIEKFSQPSEKLIRALCDEAAKTLAGFDLAFYRAFLNIANDKLNALSLRWLKCDYLNDNELKQLGINGVLIDGDDVAYAAIKIIGNYAMIPICIYFDQLEMYTNLGQEFVKRFFDAIMELRDTTKSYLVILACRQDEWENLYHMAREAARDRIEEQKYLKNFTLDDAFEFTIYSMGSFWRNKGIFIHEQASTPESMMFPLRMSDVSDAWIESKGIPRHLIRSLKTKLHKHLIEWKPLLPKVPSVSVFNMKGERILPGDTILLSIGEKIKITESDGDFSLVQLNCEGDISIESTLSPDNNAKETYLSCNNSGTIRIGLVAGDAKKELGYGNYYIQILTPWYVAINSLLKGVKDSIFGWKILTESFVQPFMFEAKDDFGLKRTYIMACFFVAQKENKKVKVVLDTLYEGGKGPIEQAAKRLSGVLSEKVADYAILIKPEEIGKDSKILEDFESGWKDKGHVIS
ncbi:MAG: ATP-binding protein, partial [Euryarchaeota archaeon]|nr:ATP-binding protein [Euryarchaeota archaeon]